MQFAFVVAKEAGIVVNAVQGNYFITFPHPGKYTVKIESQGLQPLVEILDVKGPAVRDFVLQPYQSRGTGVVIRGDRDLQDVSRHTMTSKQIKEVPASFGDSINALSSLPGVNRPMGFFGPLIIRGMDSATNGYYIDDIPLYKPMHFGGIHSVINNDIMREIDLYSSAFPSQFTSAQSAVININTVDEVKEFGGVADVGLISTNLTLKMPITETVQDGSEKGKTENKGYVIASGRYGYLSLFIPFVYKTFFNRELDWLPEYWDYQFKIKYNFNEHHSITFLAFGSGDYIDLLIKKSYMDAGADPIWAGMTIYQNEQAHSMGTYYTYTLSSRFSNTVLVYAALNQNNQWYSFPNSAVSALHDLSIKSSPYIFGLKDKVKLTWWPEHCEFRGGAEVIYYMFETSGKTLTPVKSRIDLNDATSYAIVPLGDTVRNTLLAGYAENKFTFGRFTFVPGVHYERLSRTGDSFADPRGTVTYRFPTETTIGFAGGWYSMFMQTSPAYFITNPNIAATDYLRPQKSIHRSGSLEQKFAGEYSIKIEGFYNNFWNVAEPDSYTDSDGNKRYYSDNGKLKTYGVEFMIKAREESSAGLFGWASYTFNRSSYIAHQSAAYSVYGNEWLTSRYDMTHVAKAVAGYTFGEHTISTRFQFNTPVPYTAITGSTVDSDFATTHPGMVRNVPVYGKPYTEHLSPEYRLDIRYTKKTSYRWGYVSWYIECIGILSSTPEQYTWDYRYIYSSTNPRVEKQKNSLTFIPNFGVEVKF